MRIQTHTASYERSYSLYIFSSTTRVCLCAILKAREREKKMFCHRRGFMCVFYCWLKCAILKVVHALDLDYYCTVTQKKKKEKPASQWCIIFWIFLKFYKSLIVSDYQLLTRLKNHERETSSRKKKWKKEGRLQLFHSYILWVFCCHYPISIHFAITFASQNFLVCVNLRQI